MVKLNCSLLCGGKRPLFITIRGVDIGHDICGWGRGFVGGGQDQRHVQCSSYFGGCNQEAISWRPLRSVGGQVATKQEDATNVAPGVQDATTSRLELVRSNPEEQTSGQIFRAADVTGSQRADVTWCTAVPTAEGRTWMGHHSYCICLFHINLGMVWVVYLQRKQVYIHVNPQTYCCSCCTPHAKQSVNIPRNISYFFKCSLSFWLGWWPEPAL